MPGHIKNPPPGFGPPSSIGPTRTTGTTGTAPAVEPTRAAGTSPAQPSDRFASSSKLVTQLTGRDAVRTPGQLSSNLGGIFDAAALPDRLTSDLSLNLSELISVLSLTRQQKATRLVEFLVPYAAKLAELTTAGAVPQGQRAQLEEQLLTPMSQAGLEQVVELTTGKSGVDIAKELLSSETAEQAQAFTENLKFDAPTWASRPEVALASEVKRGEPTLVAQPTIQPARDPRVGGRGKPEDELQLKDRSDKVLGRNMVWNVLHMFGKVGEAPLDEKQKREMLLATGAIIVLVITVALVIVLTLVLGK